ncbi:hypothetical protein Hanom_Chr05g00411031 [Helianthus anomalus]
MVCVARIKTAEHLFLTCGFAQTVWHLVSQWCKLPPIYAFQVRDLLDLHLYIDGSAKSKKVIQAICHMVFWCIWRCQNEVVLNQGQTSMQKIMGDVKGLSSQTVELLNFLCYHVS